MAKVVQSATGERLVWSTVEFTDADTGTPVCLIEVGAPGRFRTSLLLAALLIVAATTLAFTWPVSYQPIVLSIYHVHVHFRIILEYFGQLFSFL